MNCPRCGERIRISTYDGRCRECGNEYLQPWAVKCLKRWTFTTWPNASGRVPRAGPTEGLFTNGRKGPYLFACKRDWHRRAGVEYASFSTTLLAAARPTADAGRRTLALFVGPGPYDVSDVWVFDARRFVNQATERERTHVDSKRERDVPIYDASRAEHGIPLGDHLAGRRGLPGPTAGPVRHKPLNEFVGVEV